MQQAMHAGGDDRQPPSGAMFEFSSQKAIM